MSGLVDWISPVVWQVEVQLHRVIGVFFLVEHSQVFGGNLEQFGFDAVWYAFDRDRFDLAGILTDSLEVFVDFHRLDELQVVLGHARNINVRMPEIIDLQILVSTKLEHVANVFKHPVLVDSHPLGAGSVSYTHLTLPTILLV